MDVQPSGPPRVPVARLARLFAASGHRPVDRVLAGTRPPAGNRHTAPRAGCLLVGPSPLLLELVVSAALVSAPTPVHRHARLSPRAPRVPSRWPAALPTRAPLTLPHSCPLPAPLGAASAAEEGDGVGGAAQRRGAVSGGLGGGGRVGAAVRLGPLQREARGRGDPASSPARRRLAQPRPSVGSGTFLGWDPWGGRSSGSWAAGRAGTRGAVPDREAWREASGGVSPGPLPWQAPGRLSRVGEG